MAVDSTARLAEADVISLSQRRGEPEWLRERRLSGWRAFEEAPIPKLERTTLSEGMFKGFDLPADQDMVDSWEALPEAVRAGLGHLEARRNVIVLGDGTARFADLEQTLADRGVVFEPLTKAVVQHPELVQPYLAQEAVPATGDKPWALNAALWQDGVFLYVPSGVQLELPLQAFGWSGDSRLGIFSRTLIVAAPQSALTLVTTVTSDDERAPRVYNDVVEVYAQDGAHVRICALQTLAETTTHFAFRRAILEDNARVQWVVGEFGSALSASLCDAYLKGRGAEAKNTTVFFAGGRQHLDMEPRMFHTGEETESDILVRGVAQDQGRSVYVPLTHIDDGAFGASAFQRGKTLLLDPEARAYCIPQLHVLEEQVEGAGHAATVGQVDEEQLFYLRSRGLTPQAAKKLLVAGFFQPMLDEVPVPDVRAQLESLIDRKMA